MDSYYGEEQNRKLDADLTREGVTEDLLPSLL